MKSEKVLIVYSFLACFFLMIAGIFSARSTNQLLNAFVYLPLVFFFGTKIFHQLNIPLFKPTVSKKPTAISKAVSSGEDLSPSDHETQKEVADSNKRLFLQLIGTTGLSLLVMALFSRKARDTFLSGGSTLETVGLKDVSGKAINPAERLATDGYSITDIADDSVPAYYSFVNTGGAWYIMQNTSGTFRYAKGDSNYSASWDIRDKLRYDYFNKVFS